MEQGTKRKANDDHDARESREDGDDKRVKTKKQWRGSKSNSHGAITAKAIQPGDSGIFATCVKGQERRCISELRDLFSEYADMLYAPGLVEAVGDGDDANEGLDSIENDIQAEIAGIKKPVTAQLFTPIRLDVQCVVFFKTVAPVEPVSLVQRICEDAMDNHQRKRTRYTRRLAPMTLMGRASAEDLEQVTLDVLKPHFHTEPVESRKFAIRPNLRNHNVLSRDTIIKGVASLVGPPHKVDLKNYELLIMVEVYQNICGVSVVGHKFDQLKRYNIAEIFDPTPTDMAQQVKKKIAEPDNPDAAPSIKTELSQDNATDPPAATMDES